MENILLDFELSDEQLEMLNIHSLLKSKGVFDDLKNTIESGKYDEDSHIEKVQVWFSCSYNDYTYDVTPIYADLISKNEIVFKVQISSVYGEIKIDNWNKEEYYMMSYTITPSML